MSDKEKMTLAEKLSVGFGAAGLTGITLAEIAKETVYFTEINYDKFDSFYYNTLFSSFGLLCLAGATALYGLKSRTEKEKLPPIKIFPR